MSNLKAPAIWDVIGHWRCPYFQFGG